MCVCAFVVRRCTPSQPLDSEKNLQFDHSLPTLQHFCIQANLINELFPPGQQIRLSLVHVHVRISCAVVHVFLFGINIYIHIVSVALTLCGTEQIILQGFRECGAE